MKSSCKKLILHFLFVALIVSCESRGTPLPLSQPTEATTNFPTRIIETSTPVPTNIVSSMTMRPTLEPDKTFEFTVDLLKTNNLCDLPCFWGVTPGKSWNSAKQQLNNFVPHINDTPKGASTTLHEIPSNVGLGKLGISFNISILEMNDVVESISAQLMGENFAESLKSFTPQEIFYKYGTPETILLFVSNDLKEPEYQFFHLWLIYEEKNFYLLYRGYTVKNHDMYQICPTMQHFELEGYGDEYGSIEFGSVWGNDQNTLKDFMSRQFAPISLIYTNSKRMETVTDFNNNDFVNLFLADGTACFTTRAKVWNTQTK